MRKLLLLIAVCFTGLSYTQEIKLVDNKFTTQIMDGANELKTISFTISQETIDKIKSSETYSKTAADTEFLKKNFEKRGISDPLVVHLFSKTNGAAFGTKHALQNPTSFSIVPDKEGMIYYSSAGLTISFLIQGKNNEGKTITATSITNEKNTIISE